MSTYPSLEAFNADVDKAKNAYAADMAVENGLCAICQRRKKDQGHRRCWTCRHDKIVEVA